MQVEMSGSKIRSRAKSVSELLQSAGISREEALVKVNGVVRPDSWKLSAKDKVEIIKVVFGG